VTHRAALAAGSLALALVGFTAAAKGQGTPAAEPWRPFEGTWAITGERSTVPVEGGASAAVLVASGAVFLEEAGGLSRGFRGEAVTFDDGQGASVGRAVWTDDHGERVFSRLRGEPIEKGRRVVGTFTGGTGRYAGLEGEYSFTWQFVLPGEPGTIHGRAVRLEGRARAKRATK
jgi:hypothetical protein